MTWSALALLLVLFAWFQVAYWTSTNDCEHSPSPRGELMKAIKYCEYGTPDVLQLVEVEKPVPKDNYDNVGNRSFSERRRLLKPDGICVLAGIGSAGIHKGQLGRIAGNLTAPLRSRFTEQKFVGYVTAGSKADLNFLRDLIAAGKLRPFVEKTYPMTEVAEGLRYLNEGHARGKIIITVE